MLTLNDIYTSIMERYPYYRTAHKQWQVNELILFSLLNWTDQWQVNAASVVQIKRIILV